MRHLHYWIGNYKNANHGVVRHVGTFPHPVATPKGKIISKDQLIKEYPDHFEGIGRFPGNHKIHFKDGVRPCHTPKTEMANCNIGKA